MQNEVLPNATSVRDLGINVTNYLSPSDHVCDIAAKAHKRVSLIHHVLCLVILICSFVLIKCMSGRY